jgi:gliding motility-associated-like protein
MHNRVFTSSLWLLLLALISVSKAFGQLPPLQPEQDCINAIPICTDIYFQPNAYVGEGALPNEINPGPSCLNSGEKNDVWYIFTVQTSGTLAFTITPVNMGDDYDWAVYNLTNATCADIYNNPALEVSCNYSGQSGITGPNGLGNGGGNPNNPVVNVTAGQTYVINVSNFSSSASGYTLDLGASTATIFDNIPPTITQVTASCGGDLTVRFSENVVCASVQASDFQVEGPGGFMHTVTAVTGSACAAGGNFEDQFSLTLSPLPSFSGTYMITLPGQVQDNCGNIGTNDTAYVSITLPSLQASASPDTTCAGDPTTLSVVPQSGFTYTWSNGFTGQNPVANPNTTTIFSVTATDAAGCVYAGNVLVVVKPRPAGTFAFATDTLCDGTLSTVTYTGNGAATATYNWNFGAASVVTGSNQGPYEVIWPATGVYPVSLSVLQDGCQGPVFTKDQTVNLQPTSTFSLAKAVCVGSTTVLSYTGNAPAGADYRWNLDGATLVTGAGQGPLTVSWATPGLKNVCLEVEINGCVSVLECKEILVNDLPVIDFTQPEAQCLKGNEFTFTYNGASPVASYSWNFGDLTSLSPQTTPNHVYTDAGLFTVTLIATDSNGCENTAARTVTVHPEVEANFVSTEVCFGNENTFTALPIGPSRVTNWNWALGDGATAQDSVFAHTYAAFGDYAVTLMLETENGCKDTLTRTARVFDQPVAAFTVEAKCAYDALPFTNQTAFTYPNITWNWSFGDGQTGAAQNPAHTYPSNGNFTAILTATTDQGCTSVATNNVTVHAVPVAAIATDNVCLDKSAQFFDASTVAEPSRIVRYNWSVPTGDKGNAATFSYRFADAGRYVVGLEVATDQGCINQTSREVVIYPLPQVEFALEPVCEETEARFVNLSGIDQTISGDVLTTWTWNFGDGASVGSIPAPDHIFRDPGLFPVSLTVVSDKGCVGESTKNLEIFPKPEAPQAINDTVCLRGQAFPLTLSDDLTAAVRWYANVQDATPFYEGYGFATENLVGSVTYFVEAVSVNGCASVRVPVTAMVFDPSDLVLIPSDSSVILPDGTVQFEINGLGTVASSVWNFGEANMRQDFVAPVPGATSHTYTMPGVYTVTTLVTDTRGCTYTLATEVEVRKESGVYFSNAFTPNGDGVNDTWTCGHLRVKDFSLQVFNRWGQLVFEADRPDFEWNGVALGGGPVQEGVYMFQLKATDLSGFEISEHGSLTILR